MAERNIEIPPHAPDIPPASVPTPPVPNRAETEMRQKLHGSAEFEIGTPQSDEMEVRDTPHGPVRIGNFKPGRDGSAENSLGNFETPQKKSGNGIEN